MTELTPTKYDAGIVVHVNGNILQGVPEDQLPDDAHRHHYHIEKCGKDSWAITLGSRLCMNKETDDFDLAPMPSSLTDDFKTTHRFNSAEEAAEFLREWRVREYNRVKDLPGHSVWTK